MSMNVRVRAHSKFHNLPDGTLGVVRAWAVHRSGHNGAVITTKDGKFECVPIGLLTLVSDAEHAAPEPATVPVDAGALAELRADISKLDELNDRESRGEYVYSRSWARSCVIESARRLLAGGEA